MAELVAAGSANLESNDLILRVYGMPLQSFGYFLVGTAFSPTGVIPPGSQGVICLNSSIGRFNALDEIRFSGTTGSFAFAPDWSSIATPNGATQAMVGQTWCFQAWHRDQASSNFSNGVSVTCE
ncbi:MAG: hypothetical protein R3F17_10170 [Planctomycetota bacterium]